MRFCFDWSKALGSHYLYNVNRCSFPHSQATEHMGENRKRTHTKFVMLGQSMLCLQSPQPLGIAAVYHFIGMLLVAIAQYRVSVVLQCQLVSGWRLSKWRSVPPYGPILCCTLLLMAEAPVCPESTYEAGSQNCDLFITWFNKLMYMSAWSLHCPVTLWIAVICRWVAMERGCWTPGTECVIATRARWCRCMSGILNKVGTWNLHYVHRVLLFLWCLL